MHYYEFLRSIKGKFGFEYILFLSLPTGLALTLKHVFALSVQTNGDSADRCPMAAIGDAFPHFLKGCSFTLIPQMSRFVANPLN